MTNRDFTPTWQPYHEYIGTTGLLELGLTETLIRRLPPPDERGGNLARPRTNDTNPYWLWSTIADLLARNSGQTRPVSKNYETIITLRYMKKMVYQWKMRMLGTMH